MDTNGSIINRTALATESAPPSQHNADEIITLDINLTEALVASGGLLIASVSILFNFCVLKSLVAVKTESLKSKWFIFNLLSADLIVPLFPTFDVLGLIIYAYGEQSRHINICLKLLVNTCNPIGYYYQCLASLVMALDRLYAIVAPLKYYTVGYPRWLIWAIIISTWLIPLLLTMPAFFVPFIGSLNFSSLGICDAFRRGHVAWTRDVRTLCLVTIRMVTFAIYIILFILVKWTRERNVAVAGASLSSNRKTSASLAMTYFIVHITSLTIFLPGPIFAGLSEQWLKSVGVDRATHIIIRRTLRLLYMVNPIVDPVIISRRIPVVKHKLKLILGYTETFQGGTIEPPTSGESVDKC